LKIPLGRVNTRLRKQIPWSNQLVLRTKFKVNGMPTHLILTQHLGNIITSLILRIKRNGLGSKENLATTTRYLGLVTILLAVRPKLAMTLANPKDTARPNPIPTTDQARTTSTCPQTAAPTRLGSGASRRRKTHLGLATTRQKRQTRKSGRALRRTLCNRNGSCSSRTTTPGRVSTASGRTLEQIASLWQSGCADLGPSTARSRRRANTVLSQRTNTRSHMCKRWVSHRSMSKRKRKYLRARATF
jgi:hypothetical protein